MYIENLPELYLSKIIKGIRLCQKVVYGGWIKVK